MSPHLEDGGEVDSASLAHAAGHFRLRRDKNQARSGHERQRVSNDRKGGLHVGGQSSAT